MKEAAPSAPGTLTIAYFVDVHCKEMTRPFRFLLMLQLERARTVQLTPKPCGASNRDGCRLLAFI